MKPSEIFVTHERMSVNQDTIMFNYWNAECDLALEYGCHYSDVADFQDCDSRACAICGTVNDTTEWGWYPVRCKNAQCETIREFFGFANQDVTRPKMTGRAGTVYGKRQSMLRSRLENTLNAKRILETDKSTRFVFLLSAMIERIAYESHPNH